MVHVFSSSPCSPMANRRLLYVHQYSNPRPPAAGIASFKEESHGEVSPSPTPSSEWEETPLIFTVRQNMNREARGTPKRTWGSLFLEHCSPSILIPAPAPGKRPGTDASFHRSLAGAPLPGFASTPTHLPSKRLIKVWSFPTPAHTRFHTVRSQAPPRPGVNAHLR
ncbi:hypothetical protein FD755_001519 [Muntiacus reevesi]|uniref:Uncharacterized protein n=1 Tax=Muntiacus reevesi TaxID=9886 RepID=A0A5J5N3R5_MUNRE|nr:hypothetical protein FD755_001519 [Muntiacus reevesi]